MTKTLLQIGILLVIGLCLSTAVHAQATRTWVSGVGDDVNPCSRTAPCKTFAGAISKTATGGEINVLDSAGYGAVTITKSITIDGAGAHASILSSLVNGVIINAPATAVVTLRNLSINGIGNGINGIRFLAGGALHVENVTIFGFTQNGIDVQPSGNASLYVRGSQISDNNLSATPGTAGILIKPGPASSVSASIEDTKLDRNFFGLRAEDRATVTVTGSTASFNNQNGFQAFDSGAAGNAVVNLGKCTSSSNLINGASANNAGATLRVYDSTITNNTNFGVVGANGGTLVVTCPYMILGNAGGDGAAACP